MPATTGYSAYKVATVQAGQRKEDILLMLYDGAIRFVRFARTSLDQHNLAAKGKYICKALAIIGELDCVLDHTLGADIAGNLSSLYQYMLTRLTHANCKNDSAALDEVAALLHELQQAFATSVAQQRDPAPVPHNTPSAPTAKGLNFAI
jgi:flagellar protein FliS